ncbi:MAG: hypothetical protein E7339_07445 [Clostridiales bacterium]|nr:hypothetical protein [Clostridiales bacterium]
MKKSSIFKILTLFLTFIIFSCCSGCLIFAIAKESKQKDIQHWIEIQKERKAQADALIPEIDGYIFEALPQDAFVNQEDWESKGFIHQHNFFNWEKSFYYYYNKQKTETSFIVTVRTNSGKVFNKIIIDINEYEERLSKYFKVFPLTSATELEIINMDGEFFLVSWMPYKQVGRTLAGPPALFLLDFENNTMLYVGYAKGWLEYEIEHGKFYTTNICYKLTKEG